MAFALHSPKAATATGAGEEAGDCPSVDASSRRAATVLARAVRALACVAVGVGAPACTPTFAPPGRTMTLGAPAALEPSNAALTAGALWPRGAMPSGGGNIRLPLHRMVSLDAGGEGMLDTFAMGSVGVRVTPFDPWWQRVRAAVDVEAGVSAGAGGSRCEPSNALAAVCDKAYDGLDWPRRAAGGGYIGAGVGGHIAWFSPFARTRLQLMSATNVPVTFWYQVHGGVQLNIRGRAYVYASTGLAGYVNRLDSYSIGWIPIEGGIGMRFGPAYTWPKRTRDGGRRRVRR